jgi:hypothetical protein
MVLFTLIISNYKIITINEVLKKKDLQIFFEYTKICPKFIKCNHLLWLNIIDL